MADEYFVSTQRRADEFTGKKWLSPDRYDAGGTGRRLLSESTWKANEWYMLEPADVPGAPYGELSAERLGGMRDVCRPAGTDDELVAIVFDGASYSGAPTCLTRSGHAEEWVESPAGFPRGLMSIYVAPRQHVCLTSLRDTVLCFNGGLNGTAEGLLMREWRGGQDTPGEVRPGLPGGVAKISWFNGDTDGDGIEDWRDNCLLASNPEQADFDGDGYGNQCDRDVDGDLVLEDGDGPWGLGNGLPLEPCIRDATHEGLKYGESCDDNCDRVFNPARLDLGPRPDGDSVKDQFDLDGDGIGDSCDDDVDGDGEGLDYAWPDDYLPPPGEQKPPVPPESEREPFTECADFLWFLSEEKDDDGVCDLYNFIPYIKDSAEWMPNPEYDDRPGPGFGYLKPAPIPAHIDTMNAHYLSGSYRYHPATDVHVSPPADSGASTEPGEAGYTWAQHALGIPGDRSYFGYEGCVRNLVDVWHYYGADRDETTIARASDAAPLELTFGPAIGDLVGSLEACTMMHCVPYWDPTPSYRSRQHFALDSDAIAWSAMLNTVKFKKEQFERSLDPEMCQVDNCIRFMRLNGPADLAAQDIDPLSRTIMVEDQYPAFNVGTNRSGWCWTENLHSDAGDTGNAPTSTQLYCDFCEHVEEPTEEQCREDTEPDETSPGYLKWYKNDNQLDVNEDGIGDKCSAWVEIADLQQDHVTQRLWAGHWTSALGWRIYAMSPEAVDWSVPGDPRDRDTGLPVRNHDDWATAPASAVELAGVCNACESESLECEVKKYRVWPKQKMEFRVSGSSEDPITSTLGACACARPEQVSCYGDGDRCWRPVDGDLWRTNPDEYRDQVRDREFDDVTGRTRHPGFRQFANRTPETYGRLTITEPCQPQTRIPLFDMRGRVRYIDIGWDQNPVSAADGCQEIALLFETGDYRMLEWGYTGQVEPDPLADCTLWPRDRCWDAWSTAWRDGRGEHRWMGDEAALAYTTAMRAGILGYEFAGLKYWERQWHTPLYPRRGSTDPDSGSPADRDRPLPDALFGTARDGEVGLVYFVPICGAVLVPDTGRVDGPGPEWPWDTHKFQAKDATEAVAGITARVTGSGRAGVVLDVAEVMMGSGEVARRKESYDIALPGFPVRDFARTRLLLDQEAAAELFGYNGNDSKVTATLVLGGVDANNQPAGEVWISRSWDAAPTFERLAPGGGPPPNVDQGTVSLSSSAPPIIAPRLWVDTARDRLLLLGGRMAGGVPLDRIHAFDLVTRSWSTAVGEGGQPVPIPAEASLGELAVDFGARRAYLVSPGANGMRVFEVQLDLSVPVVREIVQSGSGPVPRRGVAVAHSSRLAQVLLFGGAIQAGVGTGDGGAGPPNSDIPPAGGRAFLGDVWGFDPRKGTWTLLRADGGEGLAREGAMLVAGNQGDIYVLGGRNEWGTLPMDRALRVDLQRAEKAAWRTTNVAEPRVLMVDGAPHQDVWRPGDPPVYTLVGHGLKVDLSTPVQVVLEADPELLELVVISSTSRPSASGDAGDGNGRATIALVPAEQYYVAVRGISASTPKTGVPYTLSAVSVLPQGRRWNIHAPRLTRFDAVGDAVYVANWSTLDVYQWKQFGLTKVASLAMQAAVDVEVANGVAYVADFQQGLVAVDVKQPAHPQVLDTEWVLGTPDSVAVHGERVFLGTGIFGVAAVDATDPAALAWVEQIVPPGLTPPQADAVARSTAVDVVTVVDVSASGNDLLVGDSGRNVWIYGVGADERVMLAGRYAGLLPIEDTALHGNTLYVSDGLGTLDIVDVTGPASPRRITVVRGPEWEVSGRCGYDILAHRGVGHGIMVQEMRELPGEDHGDGQCGGDGWWDRDEDGHDHGGDGDGWWDEDDDDGHHGREEGHGETDHHDDGDRGGGGERGEERDHGDGSHGAGGSRSEEGDRGSGGHGRGGR